MAEEKTTAASAEKAKKKTNEKYRAALAVLSKKKVKNGKKHLDQILRVFQKPGPDPAAEGAFERLGLKRPKTKAGAKDRETQVECMWESFGIILKGVQEEAATTFPYTPWEDLPDQKKQEMISGLFRDLFGVVHKEAAWALLASIDDTDTKWAKKKLAKIKRNKKPDQKKKASKKKTATKKKRQKQSSKTGRIGNIGKTVIFSTSSKRVLTFGKMDHTVKGRWATRPRFKKKPRRQFLGPDTDTITFTVELNALHGVKPRKTARNIERLVRTGKPQNVVIGGKKIGRYVITEMSEAWERVLNKGEVAKITCDLTLEEYL